MSLYSNFRKFTPTNFKKFIKNNCSVRSIILKNVISEINQNGLFTSRVKT